MISKIIFKQGIIDGIRNSRLVVCCITQKYTESKNCRREICFADQMSKPLEVLMFERLNMSEIGGVGFIITPIVRHPVYKTPDLLNEWSGQNFEGILKSIKSHLGAARGKYNAKEKVKKILI